VGGELFSSLRFWRERAPRVLWDEEDDAPFRVIKRVAPSLVTAEGDLRESEETLRAGEEPGAYTTVVEAVTPLTLAGAAEDVLTDAFERCFELLDDFIRAYRLYSREWIPARTRQRLPAIIPYATRSALGRRGWNELSLFILHMNLPGFRGEELKETELDRFNRFF
jgi:hypothetical protein